MLSSKFQRALKLAALLVGLVASANVCAGLLEKLLAPVSGPPPAGFSEGKKIYNEDTFKPDELMACIVKARDLDTRSGQAPEDVTAIEQERAKLAAEAKELTAAIEKTKDDPLPPEAAEKLNARKADFIARQQAWNARVNAANAKAVERNKAATADINAFIDNCSGRRIYRSDLEAIRPKLPFDISDILAGKK